MLDPLRKQISIPGILPRSCPAVSVQVSVVGKEKGQPLGIAVKSGMGPVGQGTNPCGGRTVVKLGREVTF